MNAWRAARTALAVSRQMGVPWTVQRAWYEVRRRTGLLAHAVPATPWDAHPAASIFLADVPSSADAYAAWRRAHALRLTPPDASRAARLRALRGALDTAAQARAEQLARGVLRCFDFHDMPVGAPPHWQRDPWTGREIAGDAHWTAIPDFGDSDIKCVWEASRGTWAYDLVRAWATTGDARWPELFWQWVEDWIANNPPNVGPNWMCGQETSFRVIAWAWAADVLADHPATTPARRLLLTRALHRFGARIAANIGYAVRQRNNHGISEPAGLLTIGLMCPELRDAASWVAIGRRHFERQIARQIYDDGSYVQHSVNYHRVMLQVATWVVALCDAVGSPVRTATRERIVRSARWLYAVQDDVTGQAPLYGANDGAHVRPLAESGARDLRPAIGAALAVCAAERAYEPGPWDEEIYWVAGASALERKAAPVTRTSLAAPAGGYYTLRSGESFAFVRCATFHDRPGHADQLALNLWWRGVNVVRDPGTYAYHAGEPWQSSLSETPAHATVAFDGLSQMPRATRFIWADWSRGVVRRRIARPDQSPELIELDLPALPAQDGLARHRRAIVRLDHATYVVIDDLFARDAAAQVHWLFPDVALDSSARAAVLHLDPGPFGVAWDGGAACSARWVKGDPKDAHHGWEAPHYRHLVAASSLVLDVPVRTHARVVTAFGPQVRGVALSPDGGTNVDAGAVRWALTLGLPGQDVQVARIGDAAEGAAWTP